MEVFFIMAKKGQKFNKYEPEFRIKVLNEYLKEGKSMRSLSRKYDISWKTIQTWVRKHKNNGDVAADNRGRPKESEEANYKEKYEILKKYLEFLEEVEQEKK
jgi:transposase-like protein